MEMSVDQNMTKPSFKQIFLKTLFIILILPLRFSISILSSGHKCK